MQLALLESAIKNNVYTSLPFAEGGTPSGSNSYVTINVLLNMYHLVVALQPPHYDLHLEGEVPLQSI